MADETLEQQIARLTTQVSELTTANTDLTGQLATRTGELRTVRHTQSFKEIALELGVKPKAVAVLQRVSGYDPAELDEADPVAVKALIEGSREEFDYCFEPPVIEPAAATTPVVKPIVKPPAQGSGKGKTPPAADLTFRVTRADVANPAWLADPRNAIPYAAAGKNGTLEVIDMD